MLNVRKMLADASSSTWPAPKPGTEYVNGWGVFALPFSSGDVLGLRVFPLNDFSPYVSIWHRNPSGRWTIYVDGDSLDTACPRYFGPACEHTALTSIEIGWVDQNSLRIRTGEPLLEWTLTARSTVILNLINAMSGRLHTHGWRSRRLIHAREKTAKSLGMGDIQLAGTMPSGHNGILMPARMYFVDESSACLDGHDLGQPIRLLSNPVIGGFRLPSRGVLVQGGAVWQARDRTPHDAAK